MTTYAAVLLFYLNNEKEKQQKARKQTRRLIQSQRWASCSECECPAPRQLWPGKWAVGEVTSDDLSLCLLADKLGQFFTMNPALVGRQDARVESKAILVAHIILTGDFVFLLSISLLVTVR